MIELIILAIIVVGLAPFSIVIVEQQTIKIIERLGKFKRMAKPGLSLKIPFIDYKAGELSLRVRQLDVSIESKTSDNVFVNLKVSVQYKIIKERLWEAFYKLEDPQVQINSYIFDVVRARVPKISIDDVFAKKDEIAKAIQEELAKQMDDYGYNIVRALVTDIDPDKNVKNAMNEIETSKRLKQAAYEKGEANKILVVKSAEADAKSKELQGEGIAKQRIAIANGLKEAVEACKRVGIGIEESTNMVLLTQYFDTLKDIGADSKSNTILIPHSPGGMTDLAEQIRTAVITANETTKKK